MAALASLVVVKVFSQNRVLLGFVEQIIDELVGMEEIFKGFSQDGEWVPALRGVDHEGASCSCKPRGSDGAVLRREDAREVHLKHGHYIHETLVLPRVHASVTAFDGALS